MEHILFSNIMFLNLIQDTFLATWILSHKLQMKILFALKNHLQHFCAVGELRSSRFVNKCTNKDFKFANISEDIAEFVYRSASRKVKDRDSSFQGLLG